MEAAAAGALYVAKNVAEGAAAVYAGLSIPTAPLKATFRQIKAPSLPRSSHSLCVVGGRAYVFGGEIAPRQPVDNDMHIITLPSAELQEADYIAVSPKPVKANGPVPQARVGHTAVPVGHRIYIFGGRGGEAMTALEEAGRVWVFDTASNTWDHLDPNSNSSRPEARSYHASAVSEKPSPIVPRNARDAENTTVETNAPGGPISGPPDPDSYGTVFVHGGCLSAGQRTSDCWAFDISARKWDQFPSAPGPDRGGASMVVVKDRIYRFGGFDGTRELGGTVDYLDLSSATYDDKAGRGEMSLMPQPPGEWLTSSFPVGSENNAGPKNRSVAGLVPINTGQGRNYLLLICGETTPSDKGHSGAGKFLDDVWSFQLRPEGSTAASVKDATRGVLMGKDTGEAKSFEVKYYDSDGVMIQESQKKPMCGRGWFGSATLGDAGGSGDVLVWGGVEESNGRLGDGWIISVE